VRGNPADRAAALTGAACLLAAALATVVGFAAGRPGAGAALGVGLALGSANAFLARWSLGRGASPSVASLGRLAALSAVGLGIGMLLLPAYAWLVPAGLGLAQLVLAGAALKELVTA
jgi:hypothetical protein